MSTAWQLVTSFTAVSIVWQDATWLGFACTSLMVVHDSFAFLLFMRSGAQAAVSCICTLLLMNSKKANTITNDHTLVQAKPMIIMGKSAGLLYCP